MIIKKDNVLMHVGTPHEGWIPHSGRWPYGSGQNPYQKSIDWLSEVDQMKNEGMSEEDIGKFFHLKGARDLRREISLAKARIKDWRIKDVQKRAEEGMSPKDISAITGIPVTTVNSYIKQKESKRLSLYNGIADTLKNRLTEVDYIDVGEQVEKYLGVTRNSLDASLTLLKQEGFNVYTIRVDQLGTNNFQKTAVTVLAPPGVDYKEVAAHMDRVKLVNDIYSIDGGTTFKDWDPKPTSVDSSRVQIRYAEDGGKDMDGVIQLRRGVDDLSLGKARYAQVRIAVDDSHYLKGMALYSDDMPDGVDIIFNTNKHKGTPMLDADNPDAKTVLKPMNRKKDGTVDLENPFTTNIRYTNRYTDANGETRKSAINIVNEEGHWNEWSKTISSQFLSKQDVGLMKTQLGETYKDSRQEFEEIKALTNPVLKKSLLNDFADNCDSAAVYLKAKGFKDQSQKVLLPVPSLKENECYCPTYDNGTEVVLIRYPHTGRFEIPRLIVNNKNREASKSITKNSIDAIGINPKTTTQLSGADFDGDTVTVIPIYSNSPSSKIKSEKYLKELQNFDPHEDYAGYPGMKRISKGYVGKAMGEVTNLLTDMDLAGAPIEERVKVVKHTMVIIDAYKHNLDYKRSAKENDILALKKKYQMDSEGHTGAGTLISRAKSQERVLDRTPNYSPDPETGEKTYRQTGKTYVPYYEVDGKKLKPKEYFQLVKEDPSVKERVVEGPKQDRMIISKRMAEAKDAMELVSDKAYPAELIYADYANKQKALANEARKEYMSVKVGKKNPSTSQVYVKEVASLEEKLENAQKHAPIERQAQIAGNYLYKTWINENPQWSKDEKKKAKGKAITQAREMLGSRQKIDITEDEWKALQLGAFSATKQEEIFRYANKDVLRKLATPRTNAVLTTSDIARAKAMLARNDENAPTLKEVASVLGVSPSTLSNAIKS